MSGGVIMAESIKTTTIACLRYAFIHAGVKIPALLRKNTITGNSNKIPLDKVTEVMVLMNEVKSILFTISSLMV